MTFLPVTGQERIQLLDLLRGFALFGILMVNMPLFNNPFAIIFGGYSIWDDPTSKAATWFIRFFFEGKFYILFSLLFGMGFQLFMQKIDENKSVLPVFRKRLMFLLLFGILHVVLLWPGDILIWYALFGFVLTWMRKKSNRSLIKWAIGFMLVPIVLTTAMMGMMQWAMSIPEAVEGMEHGMMERHEFMLMMTEKAYAIYPNGSFAELVSMRLAEYKLLLPGLLFFYPNALAMFLIGVVFMRNGYLARPAEHKAFFKRLFAISLPLGLSGAFVVAHFSPQVSQLDPGWSSVIVVIGHAVGGFFLAMTYLSLIVFCSQRGMFTKLRQLVADMGRMALTNYLVQSLIATTLYFSYGFGLYGKISPLHGIFIVVAIYLVQMVYSHYWLKAYKYGPMEWLWRSLTYGRMMPMKKA